jgi:TolB protein
MKNKGSILTEHRVPQLILIFFICLLIFIFSAPSSGCCVLGNAKDKSESQVPREERWGIYLLDGKTQDLSLVYGSQEKIDQLHLNYDATRFVFYKFVGGEELEDTEICVLNTDGSGCRCLTENNYMDVYPRWSPDAQSILFLTNRDGNMDIYIMDVQSGSAQKFYDSGGHDADIDWKGSKITFTSQSCIWIMDCDGSNPMRITDPPGAGEWGSSVLPFGDYDPRLSYDERKIVFERMVDDSSVHGNYDIFTVNSDGSDEERLTDNGYTQGLANWSKDGEKILYMVSAIRDEGKFDIYLMNSDGTDNKNITPDYFPADFLCHNPIFSLDEDKIFFIGEWWAE